MSKNMKVDPAELRASASAADTIAEDMGSPSDKAVKDADAAGGALSGWSVAGALQEIASSWRPALKGLEERTRAGAANLRRSADGHEWNDDLVSQDFEKFDTSTQAAPAIGTMGAPGGASPFGAPAWSTRPTPGEPMAPAANGAPIQHTPGAGLPSASDSPAATMPVYDPDAIVGGPAPDTGPAPFRPDPSKNPFG
ncbi:hypothetical protein GQS52_02790 [Streptomyces sp. SCUT-3]|uniref:WXG100 family type VII secretion target n=1 Tax=Streptomyces sp. SCUT-3 TaxID=2684469 RepID=UPI000CA73C3E|nr:type VII secretion target [Streptomyces sp. SCUT-3]PLW65708.1 hypothetical protein C0036_26630 [Streptomyces sp. DJ]QMV20892.1 hypothetical protein GQS52_02790 [Streptomyces sp. SCUT-3]